MYSPQSFFVVATSSLSRKGYVVVVLRVSAVYVCSSVFEVARNFQQELLQAWGYFVNYGGLTIVFATHATQKDCTVT